MNGYNSEYKKEVNKNETFKFYFKKHERKKYPYISYILAAICIPSVIIAGVIISVTLVMYPLSIILGWV
ncbi:hypothetical protein [Anaerofustis stercorihominis]|uniref:hypothetical protein n=1 Tax=Anaerofustis stercorihominis TaxID=214853 RepID=UPI0026720C64|nr:hypothetical protein [Anaerofustis stercorihominis]